MTTNFSTMAGWLAAISQARTPPQSCPTKMHLGDAAAAAVVPALAGASPLGVPKISMTWRMSSRRTSSR